MLDWTVSQPRASPTPAPHSGAPALECFYKNPQTPSITLFSPLDSSVRRRLRHLRQEPFGPSEQHLHGGSPSTTQHQKQQPQQSSLSP